jgi:hypothetical protein
MDYYILKLGNQEGVRLVSPPKIDMIRIWPKLSIKDLVLAINHVRPCE